MSNVYENPLISRYSSQEMSFIWSPKFTFKTWRRLWLSLAKGMKLNDIEVKGKSIGEEEIKEMEDHLDITDEEIKLAKEIEREKRHDVMSHIDVFGKTCPKAADIIHLGATSCFIKDNCSLVQMLESMKIIQDKLLNLIFVLKKFCLEYKGIPCLGFTHFQAAQLVTVGKRGTLWMQDFVYDFEELEHKLSVLLKSFRGVKGTTGTQASFLQIFNGDHKKVRSLSDFVTKDMGFEKSIGVSGQTYTRKIDYMIMSVLSQIAQSCHKFAVDIRLLMHMKEIEEPWTSNQVGSSAMAYKRNPMRSERICGLSRFVMSLLENCAQTHSNQWFERTLDDSANRRLVLAQGFLAMDGILKVTAHVVDGLQVWKYIVKKNVMKELPFMATENVMVEGVKLGGNRQDLHEIIRKLSMETSKRIKLEGKENDLIEKMKETKEFKDVNFEEVLDPMKFIGRSIEQVNEYIEENVDPILKKYGKNEEKKEELFC